MYNPLIIKKNSYKNLCTNKIIATFSKFQKLKCRLKTKNIILGINLLIKQILIMKSLYSEKGQHESPKVNLKNHAIYYIISGKIRLYQNLDRFPTNGTFI